MQFTPKTEEQIQRETLLPEGVYDFEVIGAEDRTSKAGNEMIALNLKVFRPDSGFIYCRDWLLESMAFKLIHFAKTTGLTSRYEAGTLCANDCTGCSGKVRLEVKENPGYPPQNGVKDYVVEKLGMGENAPAAARRMVHKTESAQPLSAAVTNDEPPF